MLQGQASPTTGKLLMLGDTNNNNNARLEPASVEDGPRAFSFKPLDLKSSQYTAEGKKVSKYVKLCIVSLIPCTGKRKQVIALCFFAVIEVVLC